MKKIFAPYDINQCYSNLSRHGKVCLIDFMDVNNNYDIRTIIKQWYEALSDANEDDYILITQDCLYTSIGCSVFTKKFSRLNLLVNVNGNYVTRNFVLDQTDFMMSYHCYNVAMGQY